MEKQVFQDPSVNHFHNLEVPRQNLEASMMFQDKQPINNNNYPQGFQVYPTQQGVQNGPNGYQMVQGSAPGFQGTYPSSIVNNYKLDYTSSLKCFSIANFIYGLIALSLFISNIQSLQLSNTDLSSHRGGFINSDENYQQYLVQSDYDTFHKGLRLFTAGYAFWFIASFASIGFIKFQRIILIAIYIGFLNLSLILIIVGYTVVVNGAIIDHTSTGSFGYFFEIGYVVLTMIILVTRSLFLIRRKRFIDKESIHLEQQQQQQQQQLQQFPLQSQQQQQQQFQR